jgi:hypothetical protein
VRAPFRDWADAALWAAIPAAPLAAALVAHAPLANAPSRIAEDLAQPLPVATAWGPFGARIFLIWFGGVLASALALAALCLRAARRDGDLAEGRTGLAAVVACAALAIAAALAWPCVLSSDVYAYAAYGDDMLRGIDSYARVAPRVHDAFLDAARWQWTKTSFPANVYGPVFTALAALAVAVTGGHAVAPTLWTLRALACVAFLCAIVLFDALLASHERRRIRLAIFALNPVAVWSVAEGHNDAFVLLAALAGALALRRGRAVAAGVLFGATPLIKAIGLAAGPPLWALLDAKDRGRFGVPFVVTALAVAAWLLPMQLAALHGLARDGRYAPQFSLQGLIGPIPALSLAGVLAIAGVRDLLARQTRGGVRLALALWLALPNAYPWYALWILPVAAAGAQTWETAALLGVTISVGLRYLPDAYGDLSTVPGALVALGELLPAALALSALRRSKPAKEATSAS